MHTLTTIKATREYLENWRKDGQRIALVPTMGNLHEGHLQLVRTARQHAGRVVVSIFVNPLQFGAGEDLDQYPRTLQADMEKLRASGCDLLFAPGEEEMYPRGREGLSYIDVPALANILCGASRPGHFRGVATVVGKLFHIIQPDMAVFGEKDYQQLLVIRHMVRDLDLPVEIIGVPTVREADGLAMSSRNAYLDTGERQRASLPHACLQNIARQLHKGNRDYASLEAAACSELEAGGFHPDYVSIRKGADLSLPDTASTRLVILLAARLGSTRLIDNLQVTLD